MKIYRTTAVIVLFAAIFMSMAPEVSARPKYAKMAGQECKTCHVSAKGGGALKPMGQAFAKNKRVWPEDRSRWTTPGATGRQHFRFAVAMIHALATVIWVIAIIAMLPILVGHHKQFAKKKAARVTIFAVSILLGTGFVLTLLRFANLKLLPLMPTGRVVLVKILISAMLLLSFGFCTSENDASPGDAAVQTKVHVVNHLAAALLIIVMLLFVM